jgi:phospholipid/cholesterol/gamma-HCH transport system permease protein
MADNSQLSFDLLGEFTLNVHLRGSWSLQEGLPSATLFVNELESASQVRSISFDVHELSSWDSSVVTFLIKISELCRERSIAVDRGGLPVGVKKLLALTEATPERKGARREATEASLLERVGSRIMDGTDSLVEMLAFLGQMTITFARLFRMKARYRASDLFLLTQQCGAQALPIVTLISFLVGVILAFVGAVQLKQFGAQIYVADLVGIAIMREMGAMMTGIDRYYHGGTDRSGFRRPTRYHEGDPGSRRLHNRRFLTIGVPCFAASDRTGFDDAVAMPLRRLCRCPRRRRDRRRYAGSLLDHLL